jgi:hypothetical protein
VTPTPILQSVPSPAKRRPFILSSLERISYRAAHRIMCERFGDVRLAGRGAYLSSCIDDIASIIMQEFNRSRKKPKN